MPDCCDRAKCCDYTPEFKFCPFCGWDLSVAVPTESNWACTLASLLTSGPPRRLCFDVDGVFCDHADPNLPYARRSPYPRAVEVARALKMAGHTLVFQTARYMNLYRGDQRAAGDAGRGELEDWLVRHGIPYHEIYLGKASADLYVDDRGCRVESDRGTVDWALAFARLLPRCRASGG